MDLRHHMHVQAGCRESVGCSSGDVLQHEPFASLDKLVMDFL
jgi:hypothetical protein